jgi:hypothetical protein
VTRRRRGSAGTERSDVLVDGDAVERDRFLHSRRIDGDHALLHGDAEQVHVGHRRVAQRRGGVGERVDRGDRSSRRLQPGDRLVLGERRVRVHHHRAGAHRRARRDHPGAIRRRARDVRVARCDQHVEREQHVDRTGARAVRGARLATREPDVADDRPGLLRQAGLVEAADVQPSSIAAVPRIWLTVTTPVPPMPLSRTVQSSRSTTIAGAGSPDVSRSRRDVDALVRRVRPLRWARRVRRLGTTVRNDGQSPCTQLASRLQLAWSIAVFRPNGVSIGCTLRQLLFAPQSPHPSHTRWSITTRHAGAAARPRLRSAPKLGGAPLVVDQHGGTGGGGERLLRVHQPGAGPHVDPHRQGHAPVSVGVVGGDDHAAHALGEEHLRRVPATSSWPVGCCPPVIETAPL